MNSVKINSRSDAGTGAGEVIREFRRLRREVEEMIRDVQQRNTSLPNERQYLQERLMCLKRSLKEAARREVNNASESDYFQPAMASAAVRLNLSTYSDPLGADWRGKLSEVLSEIDRPLAKLESQFNAD